MAITAARLYGVAPAWAAFQERAAIVREGLAVLPPGARALVVSPGGCKDPDVGSYGSLTVFAVIDRRAFVNTLFAQSGIQPVAPADPVLNGGPTIAMDAALARRRRARDPACASAEHAVVRRFPRLAQAFQLCDRRPRELRFDPRRARAHTHRRRARARCLPDRLITSAPASRGPSES